jgi:acetate---CoA ligase (ADP-forming)
VQLEAELVEKVREHGMRMVGPNCMGVLSTRPGLSMNATFAPTMPPAGPVSFMSQSGAMGVTILDYAAEYGIGIADFVSVGNKPDVSGNDLVQFWAEDERTSVILMYLENFGNPQRFTQLARRITKEADHRGEGGSYGGGCPGGDVAHGRAGGADVAVDALLGQSGVIRVDTVEDLFDLAMAFDELPGAGGEPGGHRDERGRTGDHHRGRVRVAGAGGGAAVGIDAGVAAGGAGGGGERPEPGGHDRLGHA